MSPYKSDKLQASCMVKDGSNNYSCIALEHSSDKTKNYNLILFSSEYIVSLRLLILSCSLPYVSNLMLPVSTAKHEHKYILY